MISKFNIDIAEVPEDIKTYVQKYVTEQNFVNRNDVIEYIESRKFLTVNSLNNRIQDYVDSKGYLNSLEINDRIFYALKEAKIVPKNSIDKMIYDYCNKYFGFMENYVGLKVNDLRLEYLSNDEIVWKKDLEACDTKIEWIITKHLKQRGYMLGEYIENMIDNKIYDFYQNIEKYYITTKMVDEKIKSTKNEIDNYIDNKYLSLKNAMDIIYSNMELLPYMKKDDIIVDIDYKIQEYNDYIKKYIDNIIKS